MDSIKIRQYIGQDGILHLDIPVEMPDTEIEVTLTIQRVTPQQHWYSCSNRTFQPTLKLIVAES
jgi:hypothetical protein